MKKLFLLSLLSILSVFTVFAQENTLLWKVSGKDLKVDSYLFGTIHMLCEEDFKMPEKLKQASALVDQVIFEVDMQDPNTMAQAQKAAMTPKADFFKDYDADKLKFIDSALTANQFSIKMFDMVSPSTMLSLLTIKAFACSDITKMKSFEKEILDLNAGKTIESLESVDYQMNILSKLATPDYFYAYLKNLNKYDGLTKQLVTDYTAENLEALTKMFQDKTYMSEEQYNLMLTARNQNWIEILPAKIQNTKSLIAVGAGHLVGDTGLIKLLRDKGYTVTPVH